MKKLFAVLTFLLLSCAYAEAQSTCTYITPGAVLTAAQWNFCFSSKNDALGYTPVNKVGDVMLGPLITAAATVSLAGLNVSPGVAPTVPTNGDVWVTAAGMFVRAGGVTIGPLTGSGTASTFTNPVTITLNAAALPATDTGTLLHGASADATVSRIELTAAGAAAIFTGRASNGTIASPTTLTNGTLIASHNAHGYDGTSWSSLVAGAFRLYAEGTWSNTSHPTEGCISTTPSASTTIADIMCVHQDGGITVGAPTGGDKGAGTINTPSHHYINGNTVAETASSPLSLNVTTGALSLNTVPLNFGGTNNTLTASNGGIVWSDATKLNILSGTATAGQHLQSGASATPSWTAATFPSDVTTAGQVIVSSAAHTYGTTVSPVLGVNAASTGTLGLANGGVGGATVTIENLGATTGYNFNLPSTAGAANSVLLSQGGAGNLMTWAAAGQLPGTATNDSASSGNVGEYISTQLTTGTAFSLANNTVATPINITITAGDWDVFAECEFQGTATTSVSFMACGLSTTAGAFDTATSGRISEGGYATGTTVFNAMGAFTLSVGPSRYSVNANTTINMVTNQGFSASTMTVYGILRARRVR